MRSFAQAVLRTVLALTLVISSVPALSPAPAPRAQDVLQEATHLATIPEDMSLEAAPVRLASGEVITGTHRVHWSADGRQVAYIGKRDGVEHPVIGDEVFDSYDFIGGPTFSGDGRHVVFRVGKRLKPSKERWWVLYDGETGDKEDWLGSVGISHDGSRIAYWTQPGARVVTKGPDKGAYTGSSQEFVVLERRKKNWKRAESPRADSATSLTAPVFSHDGRLVFTACTVEGVWKVMRWEKGEKRPDSEGGSSAIPEELAIRADGERWAAVHDRYGQSSGTWTLEGSDLWVDGAHHAEEADALATPVFAPTGERFAYKVRRGDLFGIGIAGGDTGIAGGADASGPAPSHEFVFAPVFSPDATRIAYVVAAGAELDLRFGIGRHAEDRLREGGGERFVIVEDVATRTPEQGPAWLEIRDLSFSPDGQHLAYAARSEKGWQVVLDHVAGPVHDEVGSPRFGPGSTFLGYGSRDGSELWWRIWAEP